MLHDFSDTLAFVKVVQAGSFTSAARALDVPKTRISRKVQELERRLGVQLLKRTTRKLGLTEAGAVYFQHCEGLSRSLEEAESAVGALQSGPRGLLRITAPYWFACSVLASLLIDFRTLYPEVRAEITMASEALDIVSSNLDIALRLWRGPLPDSGLAVRNLGRTKMQLFASEQYVEHFGQPQSPDELIKHHTLSTPLWRSKTGFAWSLRKAGPIRDFPIDPVVIASDPEMLTPFMLAGQGVIFTQELRMRALIAQRRVRTVLPDWTGPAPFLYALMPAARSQPPKTRVFLDFLASRLDL